MCAPRGYVHMVDAKAAFRILEPFPGLFAYYAGRLEPPPPGFLEDWFAGALGLGVASYAIVDGASALVYDTHISVDHGRAVRQHLEGLGVRQIRVVLSHWHEDHVAGNAAFADCEIIALRLTAETLERNRAALARRPPGISPLVMPNRLFEGRLDLAVGKRQVELHHFDIHSADGNVVWLPAEGILLAGDTLEDTVTFIAEASNIPRHMDELARLKSWPIARILPNHGDPARIAKGGFDTSLIDANRLYLEAMLQWARDDTGPAPPLVMFAEREIASGAVAYFAPYESVHQQNAARLAKAWRIKHPSRPSAVAPGAT
jgi:cyclase